MYNWLNNSIWCEIHVITHSCMGHDSLMWWTWIFQECDVTHWYSWVTAHTWMSHVHHINESRPMHEWVITWISHQSELLRELYMRNSWVLNYPGEFHGSFVNCTCEWVIWWITHVNFTSDWVITWIIHANFMSSCVNYPGEIHGSFVNCTCEWVISLIVHVNIMNHCMNHTCEWVITWIMHVNSMSHCVNCTRWFHGSFVNYTCEWVISWITDWFIHQTRRSPVLMSPAIHKSESRRTHGWVMSHVWMNHVPHVNASSRESIMKAVTYEVATVRRID